MCVDSDAITDCQTFPMLLQLHPMTHLRKNLPNICRMIYTGRQSVLSKDDGANLVVLYLYNHLVNVFKLMRQSEPI